MGIRINSHHQRDCVAKTSDPAHLAKIEQYMSQYNTADKMYAHVESDLAWNSISIAYNMAQAKSNLAAGKFKEYGANYGIMVGEVVIGTNKISATEPLGAEEAVSLAEVAQI